jgi:hypothetical protein
MISATSEGSSVECSRWLLAPRGGPVDLVSLGH